MENGFNKVSIISGVGVRGFYRKNGYTLNTDGEFMEKILKDITELSKELNLINKKTGKPANYILRFWEKEFKDKALYHDPKDSLSLASQIKFVHQNKDKIVEVKR